MARAWAMVSLLSSSRALPTAPSAGTPARGRGSRLPSAARGLPGRAWRAGGSRRRSSTRRLQEGPRATVVAQGHIRVLDPDQEPECGLDRAPPTGDDALDEMHLDRAVHELVAAADRGRAGRVEDRADGRLDADLPRLALGLVVQDVGGHQAFRRAKGPILPSGSATPVRRYCG